MAADRQVWIDQITRFVDGVERGFVIGLEVPAPMPWPPAVLIMELLGQGYDVAQISKKVGYAKYTVERAIKTRGYDRGVGDQCWRHAGRVFSIEDALREMPLPCGPECICSWRPIFRTDQPSPGSPCST